MQRLHAIILFGITAAFLVFLGFMVSGDNEDALGLFGLFKKSPRWGNQQTGGGTVIYCGNLGDRLEFAKAGGVGLFTLPVGVSLESVFNSRRVTVGLQ